MSSLSLVLHVGQDQFPYFSLRGPVLQVVLDAALARAAVVVTAKFAQVGCQVIPLGVPVSELVVDQDCLNSRTLLLVNEMHIQLVCVIVGKCDLIPWHNR